MAEARVSRIEVCSPLSGFAIDNSLNMHRGHWDQNIRGAHCNYEKEALLLNMRCCEQDSASKARIASSCTNRMDSLITPSHYETPRYLPQNDCNEDKKEESMGSWPYGSPDHVLHVSVLTHRQRSERLCKLDTPKTREHLRPYDRAVTLTCSFLAASGAAYYESSRPGKGRQLSCDTNKDGTMVHDLVLLAILQRLGPDVLALFVFTAATRAIYRLNKQHQRQDYSVLCGIVFGTIAGMAVHRDLQSTMLKAVPWAILVALLAYTVVCKVWTSKNDVQALMMGCRDRRQCAV